MFSFPTYCVTRLRIIGFWASPHYRGLTITLTVVLVYLLSTISHLTRIIHLSLGLLHVTMLTSPLRGRLYDNKIDLADR